MFDDVDWDDCGYDTVSDKVPVVRQQLRRAFVTSFVPVIGAATLHAPAPADVLSQRAPGPGSPHRRRRLLHRGRGRGGPPRAPRLMLSGNRTS